MGCAHPIRHTPPADAEYKIAFEEYGTRETHEQIFRIPPGEDPPIAETGYQSLWERTQIRVVSVEEYTPLDVPWLGRVGSFWESYKPMLNDAQ